MYNVSEFMRYIYIYIDASGTSANCGAFKLAD